MPLQPAPNHPRRIFAGSPLRWHGLGWGCYLAYEQCLVWYTHGSPLPTPAGLYFYGCNAVMFYLQLGVLRYCFQEARPRYAPFAGLLPAALLIVLGLKAAGEYLLVLPELKARHLAMDWSQYLALDFFRNIYFTIVATLIWAASHIREYRLQAAEAQRQQLVSERDQAEADRRYGEVRSALLQQQLHPHLLSNTLNFVYSRVFQASPEAGHCILLLAGLMRYTTGETDPDGKVLLSEEVEQIRQLIRLNQYRYHYPLALQAEFCGDFTGLRIIPLLLLTLCENVFKHGLLDEAESPAVFRLIRSGERTLQLYLRDRKRAAVEASHTNSGIGLRNLRIRLAHSYPGKHELRVEESAAVFQLTLNMEL